MFNFIKRRLIFGAALLAAAVGAGVPAPASAEQPDWQYGKLISMNSDPYHPMCLAAPAQGIQGDPVFQMDCYASSRQLLWHMEPVGNDTFKIFSNGDLCLDVLAFNHDNFGTVTAYQCKRGFSNQEWYRSNHANGFLLLPMHARTARIASSKCLDVFAYRHDDRAQVVQWDCLGGANQVWRFSLWS